MIILGIETSCDETAASVVQKTGNRITILSNIVASSAPLQAKYGGVIPEQAAREQLASIIPVIKEALLQAPTSVIPTSTSVIPAKAGIYTNNLWIPDQVRDDIVGKIDAIAVTQGPGLIGSLLVGVETAKTLATIWNKPLIPVNHLLGHFYANWINTEHLRGVPQAQHHLGGEKTPMFPCVGLLVSGGHTDLILMRDHGKYEYLGGTRDDAAGECFDKSARLLGLPYPGGPIIAKLAEKGNSGAFKLPRPMIDSGDFDFSFSGLKTAVANLLHTPEVKKSSYTSGVKCNLAASVQQAIIDVLVEKTILATQKYKIDQIIIAGGVAANQSLVRNLKLKIKNLKLKAKLFAPSPPLCTDNAAMIAAAAFFSFHPTDPLTLQANPNLSLGSF